MTGESGEERRAVIVVDMLRGFLEPGRPLDCGESARAIIPAVRRRIEEEQARGATVFWVADNHAPDDEEFAMFPPHCIRGTAEAEVIPALADLVDPANLLPKTRYSGFYGTNLAERLAALRPGVITVVGVCTDICVMHTVADARNRDYRRHRPCRLRRHLRSAGASLRARPHAPRPRRDGDWGSSE